MSGFLLISSGPVDVAPARTPRGGAASRVQGLAPGETVAPRPGVLWVDDDPSINRMAERLLPSAGFNVTIATDQSTAMLTAGRGNYQVIVLDQRLPGSPELEVLRNLREVGDATPVIVHTGHESLQAATEALTLGVVDYLVKPSQTNRILAALRIAVRVRAYGRLWSHRCSFTLATRRSL